MSYDTIETIVYVGLMCAHVCYVLPITIGVTGVPHLWRWHGAHIVSVITSMDIGLTMPCHYLYEHQPQMISDE